MSFYTSLTGLKAAQTDLATISNNVANVGSTGFIARYVGSRLRRASSCSRRQSNSAFPMDVS